MKLKLLALSCCLAAAFTAQAQTTEVAQPENKTYKPTAGDITTEVAVNLEYGISLNRGGIRVRKFIAADKAYRLGAQANYVYDKTGDESYQTTFGISIAPGIEKHFAGTSRLSPYIGAELPIGYRGTKSESASQITKGSWTPASGCSAGNRANYNIGLNGLAGVDYYIAPRFYAGFELGAGIRYSKEKDVTTTYKNDYTPDEEYKGYHSISFSPFSTGGIRLGFVF
ncbi:hypothetical protein I0P70_13970 [Pontibacter sp. FD36]|uniref:hypothetical protein n=1 Tax=Pontibacter sp. FD36 TaxID=2789860 RepID=UPI0018A8D171|nr:hypothetical protein [Pontibacter sp. FD36]MBF8964356.1 hypothetical protein [Pontibacter sp. FD36]